eukprot:ctg_667.g214
MAQAPAVDSHVGRHESPRADRAVGRHALRPARARLFGHRAIQHAFSLGETGVLRADQCPKERPVHRYAHPHDGEQQRDDAGHLRHPHPPPSHRGVRHVDSGASSGSLHVSVRSAPLNTATRPRRARSDRWTLTSGASRGRRLGDGDGGDGDASLGHGEDIHAAGVAAGRGADVVSASSAHNADGRPGYYYRSWRDGSVLWFERQLGGSSAVGRGQICNVRDLEAVPGATARARPVSIAGGSCLGGSGVSVVFGAAGAWRGGQEPSASGRVSHLPRGPVAHPAGGGSARAVHGLPGHGHPRRAVHDA